MDASLGLVFFLAKTFKCSFTFVLTNNNNKEGQRVFSVYNFKENSTNNRLIMLGYIQHDYAFILKHIILVIFRTPERRHLETMETDGHFHSGSYKLLHALP